MIKERIKEIADFVKSESPYQSANKGWLTDDIYLQRGPNRSDSSKDFDQLLKVSFFWQPIIQIALTIFLVIAFATIFAFTPLAFLNGRFNNLPGGFELKQIQIPIESIKLGAEENREDEKNIINKSYSEKIVEDTNQPELKISENSQEDGNKGNKTNIDEFSSKRENKAGLILRF